MDEWLLILLALGGFSAGFVDAVVGGGGLIQIPLLFSAFTQHVPAVIFGTNKIASIFGTATAAVHFAKRIKFDLKLTAVGALFALGGSFLGARSVAYLDPEVARPLVLAMLVAVAIYTFKNKNFGTASDDELVEGRSAYIRLGLIAVAIGFYDGFFGPGTGSFFIFLMIRFLRMDFLRASATAKVLNFATNLAAIGYFASIDAVLWQVGLTMAVANVLGAITGSHLAIKHGAGFVRRLFLVVVVALISKMAYDMM
ncbi:sulfite exporter TauE/SafE family protein [Nitrogeniibacter aestuarii]|uniref:sulfite exporter TauE/SafE family protein n=1 Tax=Nitrogeniibacter aestuarii TaxID=2815343 RepID=UPI001E4934C9|nr:TSUP family transporter [Nitrogeniibacter aestuarii]